LSLILVGSGTIFFSIQQYKNRHNEILSEKIQSVYIELVHKLEYEQKLTPDWSDATYDNLDELLQKFSNVFYTDINLYDKQGKLLATSRPGIFNKELVGARMNPAAYVELVLNEKAEYIHNERIGSLNYMSAYVPFINSENELLAYLNLPYFTRQNVWSKELSSLVATIVNVYVLLILLSIGIAVFISEKITLPLRMIQLKFSEIELGKKYEKIYYPKNDEIGSLVREYNRMVEELEKSIELLARSERESAWREMAKQIAHEIKNPLTPMRLNVQHLQRAWKDSREDKEKYIDRVSKTIIEQIDNLSAIATEFSNFAKMPRATNKKINLLEVISSVLQLYENNEDINLQLITSKLSEKIEVYADKEQLNRVFVNLITNGIQSVPEGRKVMIIVEVLTKENNAEVRITDNGRGIPEELQEKLFQPNFTTKSAGMGLGLAIVKNILINAGGSIDYITQLHQGTTFIVRLPLL
ncbi:MAG TPA: ATP-binding protein, partial [Bacteroidales bacterium]|nr:ATP-binding protein [Bacteroidales bacterium]